VVHMTFNDLLIKQALDPKQVIVMRHRPTEPQLNKIMPWLAVERPDLFDAYQQTQGERVERVLQRAKYVASFLGMEPAKAMFAGLYSVDGWKEMSCKSCAALPAIRELIGLGMDGFDEPFRRPTRIYFTLSALDFYLHWKGKLVIGWPPPGLAWWRWSHKNDMPVLSILDESVFDKEIPQWDDLVLSWNALAVIPKSLRAKLTEWRGIYYILIRKAAKDTLVRHQAMRTSGNAWSITARPDTAATNSSRLGIQRTSSFQFSNASRLTWTRKKSFGSKTPGKRGFTHVLPSVSTKIESAFY
jgi:hypothetical protein